MRKLTYVNSLGESITFHKTPYLITSLTGISEVEAETQGQKSPGQDGDTYIDSLLEPRFPTLEGVIVESNLMKIKEYRSQILRVCNPKYGLGKLTLELDGDIKEIDAVLDGVPVFPERKDASRVQTFMIVWKCPNPYWQDVNPTNIKLEDYVANFSFPFSFPVTFSIRGDSRTIVNSGHVPTPIKVTFRGNSVNPKITKNNTGEFIKVNRTIPEGYNLVITTDFNNKSVKIIAPDGVESNAMGYIDLDSTFFDLDVGENHLSFITEGGKPEVFIEYRNLFIGV